MEYTTTMPYVDDPETPPSNPETPDPEIDDIIDLLGRIPNQPVPSPSA